MRSLVSTPVARIENQANTYTAKDDSDAIDQSNIVEGRTRGAAPEGRYREPGDEEGLPADDGTSSGAST